MTPTSIALQIANVFFSSFFQAVGWSVGIAVGVKVLLHKSAARKAREQYEEALKKVSNRLGDE